MLYTSRLHLRRFTPEDFADFASLIRDKQASPMAVYDHEFPTDDEGIRGVLDFFSGAEAFVAVELREEGRVIGLMSLHAVDEHTRDLGYTLHSAYQHRGYAREAAQALVDYARNTLGATRLTAGTAQANAPSIALLEHLGFRRTSEGTASFAKDEKGQPIVFTSCGYEMML